MAKVYKTARGQMLDVDKLKLANETTVSVGNMRVNARGDVIGQKGQVTAGRNAVMDQVYAVEPAPWSPNDSKNVKAQKTMAENNRAKELIDLTNNLVVTNDEAAEDIEADEFAAPQQTRGSLASSLAKTTSVVQEPLPKPSKKSNGPTRF